MNEERILRQAREIMKRRRFRSTIFENPASVKDYLCLRLGGLEFEVFGIIFLDAQHGLITFEEMFRGTLRQTSVYPREVVKRALQLNAAAVVFTHNHPSCVAEPSRADEHLTQNLKTALALVDIRVIDHIVIGGCHAVSFAERGLL